MCRCLLVLLLLLLLLQAAHSLWLAGSWPRWRYTVRVAACDNWVLHLALAHHAIVNSMCIPPKEAVAKQ